MPSKKLLTLLSILFLSSGLLLAHKLLDVRGISLTALPAKAQVTKPLPPSPKANPTLTKDQEAKVMNLAIPWVNNNGQIENQSVKFSANTLMGTVFVTKDGTITYSLIEKKKSSSPSKGGDKRDGARQPLAPQSSPVKGEEGRGVVLKETPMYKNTPIIQGADPSPTKTNYFLGNDKTKWKSNVSTYNLVSYGYIYPQIKLKLTAHNNNVEKIYTVYPKGNPGDIKMKVDGAKKLEVTEDGNLKVTPNGVAEPIYFTAPIAYQELNKQRIPVSVKYKIQDNTYSFDLGTYNLKYPLTIDPSFNYLLASTLVGGSDTDTIYGVVLDSSGNIYITGQTASTNFPVTAGAPSTTYGGGLYDAHVTKLANDFKTILASTYLGGTGTDIGVSIALDSLENVYVTGYTGSSNFPVTVGAASTTYGGHDYDTFVSKLNSGLTTLIASTYLGGSGDDYGNKIIFDASGNIYIGGQTTSSNFPGTSGGYQPTYNGNHDGFIAKLNSNLTTILAASYLGASNHFDTVNSIVRGSAGDIYVVGYTRSPDFPTTAGAASTTYGGGTYDAFISRLNSGLTTLIASTFFGGTGDDLGISIALDASGNVYISGDTTSVDLPASAGGYQTSYGGGSFLGDAYVAKFNGDLTQLFVSTYLGGNDNDAGYSLAIDSLGNVYVAGYTASANFPVTASAYQTTYGGGAYDNFVSKLSNNLTSLSASTYLGGNGTELYTDLNFDSVGNLYLVARTGSSNFPTTPGVYQTSYGGGAGDAFIAKFGSLLPNVASVAPNSIQQNSGAITLTVTGSNFIPTSVVKFDGNAKTTTYISATQLTATISSSDYQNIGNHNVTVFNPLDDGGTSASAPFLVTTTGISSPKSPTAPASTTENPTGVFSLLINPVTLADGSLISATSASDRLVTLKFLVGADTTYVAISEDPDFKNAIQESYVSTKTYLLSPGDGTKTIYAKFYSLSGVSSPVVSTSIVLNTASPQAPPVALPPPVTLSPTAPVAPSKETETLVEEKRESIASPGVIIFTKTLAFGSTGSEVKSLQQELQSLGFFPKTQKLTTYFGPITRRSLMNFQKAHNIPPVGVVGPRTRAALNGM